MHISQDRTTILLVRHGECRGNREGLFRGRTDFPLNQNGFMQAEDLAREINRYHPDVLLTSPLTRAVQTAQAISKLCQVKVQEQPELNNIQLGPWEGRYKKEIATLFPLEWQKWIKQPENLNIPGMETLSQVKNRVKYLLDRCVSEFFGQTILFVSHRAVLKPLIAACLGMTHSYFWRIHLDTASYTILHYKKTNGYILVQLNQNRHLKKFVTEWQ